MEKERLHSLAYNWRPPLPEMLFTLSFTLLFLWCAFTALRHLRQQLAIGQLLRSIPGPTIWEAICLNWNVLYGGSHPFDDGAPVGTKISRCLTQLCRTYGGKYGVVKCWTGLFPPCILICNGPLGKSLLAHKELQNKADIYTLLGKTFSGFSLLTCTEMEAKGYRQEFSPFFKRRALEEYLPTFTRHLTLLQERIEGQMAENEGVCLLADIKPLLSTLILDTLGENFFAFEFKSQERKAEPSFIKEMEISFKMANKVILQQWRTFFHIPILAEIFLCLGDSISETVQHVKSLVKFKLTMLTMIANKAFHQIQRQSNDQVPGSLLDFLVNSRVSLNRWSPFALFNGIRETLAHASIITIAGHDTTTATLTWILYFLAKNEPIRKKVYAEVDSFLSSKEGEPSVQSLASLKYIEAVIKETMRLVPVAPYLGRKVVNHLEVTLPEDIPGESLSQRIILPQTANVIVAAQVIQSQEKYFANASTFWPERFLDAEGTGMSPSPAMMASAYFPFSGGMRTCIGHQYAMLQMKMALLCLCKAFNWTVEGHIQLAPSHYMIQGAARFPVQFTKRN